MNKLLFKIERKLKRELGILLFQKPRILKYKFLSYKNVTGKPKINQPVLFRGLGNIIIKNNVTLGISSAACAFNGYIHLDARSEFSIIEIEDNVVINNNCRFISEGEGIFIGKDTVIGTNVEVIDSDFHDLAPESRRTGKPKTKKVIIGENVFIGSNAVILKGVTIGNNSIIANGAIVTKSVAENTICGGNPAKVIKKI